MTAALGELDANDRDFARRRGMLWGAGAGLSVPVTVVIVGAFFDRGTSDAGIVGVILALIGIPAVIGGAITGVAFAALSARLLARGVKPIVITALSGAATVVAATLIIALVTLWLVNDLRYFDFQTLVSMVFLYLLFCIPAIFLAMFGVWHTLRALVQRNTWPASPTSPTTPAS